MSSVPVQKAPPSVLFLMTVTVINVLATNLYVPSLPDVAQSLRVSDAEAQFTLTAFLLAFAAAQLVYGPLADRLGRRRMMLAGLFLFLAGSALAAVAPSIGWLTGARVLQALGAAGGTILARAMVRDLYDRDSAARMMAYLGIGSGLAGAAGPFLGGWLQVATGTWRGGFIVLAVFTLVPITVISLVVRETLKAPAPSNGLGTFLANYLSLLRQPGYSLYAIGGAVLNGAFFAFLVAVPFVLERVYGLTPAEVGLVLINTTVGYMAGNLLAARLGARLGLERLVLLGGVLCMIPAGAMVLLGGWSSLGLFAILGPMLVYGAGAGLAIPPSGVIAVSVNPRIAATASGLYGFLSFSISALGTVVAGQVGYDSIVPTALVLAAMSATAVGLYAFGIRHARRNVAP